MKKQILLIASLCAMFTACENPRDMRDTRDNRSSTSQDTNDQQVANEIRQRINNDRSLSNDARNIQVSASRGTISLKGNVTSEQEKNHVLNLAKQFAGNRSIDNKLSVSNQTRS